MTPEKATTLYEYYTAIGQSLPSVAVRADVYQSLGLGTAASYTGTADQNTNLLNKLKSLRGPAATPAPAPAPAQQPAATPTQQAQNTNRTLPSLPEQTPDQERTLESIGIKPRTLPEQSSSGLLNFSNSLNSAVSKARERRAQIAMNLTGLVPSGTVPFSSFNGILRNLQSASESTARDLTSTAVNIADRDATRSYNTASANLEQIKELTIKALENGAPDSVAKAMYEAEDPVQAAALGSKYLKASTTASGGSSTGKILNPDGTTKQDNIALPKPFTSGTKTFSGAEQVEIYNILSTGKTDGGTVYGNATGADGFVDPAVYLKLLDAWRSAGGQISDFIAKWAPKDYINPVNTWIGAELAKRGVSWSPAKTPSSGGSGSSGGGSSSSSGRTI